MRNRISHPIARQYPQKESKRVATRSGLPTDLNHRPTLQLGDQKSITVDMERFFEFSFSFAEALVSLEDRFGADIVANQSQVRSREQVIRWNEEKTYRGQDFGCDFEIDARWM